MDQARAKFKVDKRIPLKLTIKFQLSVIIFAFSHISLQRKRVVLCDVKNKEKTKSRDTKIKLLKKRTIYPCLSPFLIR